jgi:hypothetical protein
VRSPRRSGRTGQGGVQANEEAGSASTLVRTLSLSLSPSLSLSLSLSRLPLSSLLTGVRRPAGLAAAASEWPWANAAGAGSMGPGPRCPGRAAVSSERLDPPASPCPAHRAASLPKPIFLPRTAPNPATAATVRSVKGQQHIGQSMIVPEAVWSDLLRGPGPEGKIEAAGFAACTKPFGLEQKDSPRSVSIALLSRVTLRGASARSCGNPHLLYWCRLYWQTADC